jgi:hypothetical protein
MSRLSILPVKATQPARFGTVMPSGTMISTVGMVRSRVMGVTSTP